MFKRLTALNSIALRLSAMFALVALLVFVLIGGALYQQVDKSIGRLPEAELDARYSVLESSLNRYGNPEHWAKISSKLKLLSEEDKRIRFWAIGSDPAYEYGNPDAAVRAFAQGPPGVRDLRLPGEAYPFKVLSSEIPAKEQRPALRFLIAIDTQTFRQTQHHLLIALVSLASIGVLLASLLGYWVARIGLKPLVKLSEAAQKLAPPHLSGRLHLAPLAPELDQLVSAFNSTLDRVEQAWTRLESFNADVAHELRSPLTNLIGQTQVALTRGRSAEHYFEVLQSNLEELERLRSIINNLREQMTTIRGRSMSYPGRLVETMDEHRNLVEAIAAHDVERAQYAARIHLENAEHTLMRSLSEHLPQKKA